MVSLSSTIFSTANRIPDIVAPAICLQMRKGVSSSRKVSTPISQHLDRGFDLGSMGTGNPSASKNNTLPGNFISLNLPNGAGFGMRICRT